VNEQNCTFAEYLNRFGMSNVQNDELRCPCKGVASHFGGLEKQIKSATRRQNLSVRGLIVRFVHLKLPRIGQLARKPTVSPGCANISRSFIRSVQTRYRKIGSLNRDYPARGLSCRPSISQT
jgi:hypothetical protein